MSDGVKVPKKVSDNAREGLELHEKYGRGGTDVGVETARKLAKGGELSVDEVRHIAQYFPRHANDNLEQDGGQGDAPSNGFIAWQLWGGDEGRTWAENHKDED